MIEVEVEDGTRAEVSEQMILAQLDAITQDEVFRSSKRSVAFLRYVVEQTLKGSAELIKERTIGVEVFDRPPTYDTNVDHVVRTAASELRKRLAIYYGEGKHRSELRVGLVPGSYIPRFSLPAQVEDSSLLAEELPLLTTEGKDAAGSLVEPFSVPAKILPLPIKESSFKRKRLLQFCGLCLGVLLLGSLGYGLLRPSNPQDLFWKPVLETPGPVRLAVGYVPNGPPTSVTGGSDSDSQTPVLPPDSSKSVPFADAVTIARVVGSLESRGKKVIIRRENASSFSDFRENAVVLVGAFNNEWSMRLTRQLRYSLALDPERSLVYIKDAQNPSSRSWAWATNQPRDHVAGAKSPVMHDYALISRIWNSETGHVVIVIGGLYTYGTQAAGEFLSDPNLMQAIAKVAKTNSGHQNLQIVLGTTVTDDTPGPAKVLAVSSE